MSKVAWFWTANVAFRTSNSTAPHTDLGQPVPWPAPNPLPRTIGYDKPRPDPSQSGRSHSRCEPLLLPSRSLRLSLSSFTPDPKRERATSERQSQQSATAHLLPPSLQPEERRRWSGWAGDAAGADRPPPPSATVPAEAVRSRRRRHSRSCPAAWRR